MNIELWPVEFVRIKPYPENPRQNDGAVDAVAASIREFGFRQPIVVDDDGVIVVGHTRCKAALKLGLETGAGPRRHRSDARADQGLPHRRQPDGDDRRLGLRAAARSSWPTCKELDFDLESARASPKTSWPSIIAGDVKEGLTDPDDMPATARRGDHAARATCGSSVTTGCCVAIQQQAGGRGPAARRRERSTWSNTDPPYNVKVEPRSNNAIAAGLSVRSRARQHHQSLDLARHPEKSKPTQKKLRAKDRPLANDFVTDDAFDVLLACVVRQHGSRARAWAWLLHLGRLCATAATTRRC